MEMTDDQLELLHQARQHYPLGVEVQDEYIVEAHDLADRGWLKRGFAEDGRLLWRWTDEAEAAIYGAENRN